MADYTTVVIREPDPNIAGSGLVVEMAPLTIKEDFICDQLLGEILGENVTQAAMMLSKSKVQSICAIRKINGVPVSPLGGLNSFEDVYQKFTLREFSKIQEGFVKAAGIDVESLKNESSAEGSDS